MFFDRFVKTASYLSEGIFCGEIFLCKKYVFSNFSVIERQKFGFLQTIIWRDCEKTFLRFQRSILKKDWIFKKNFLVFMSFSHAERNFLGFITNFFQPGRHNCILCVYRNNLSRKFWWKKLFPHHFWTSKWGKLSVFWNTFLERVVEVAFYMSIGTLCRNFFWRKKKHILHCFWTGSWKILAFVKVFSAGTSKLLTNFPKEFSREKFMFEKMTFSDHIRTLSKTFSFLWKI